METVHFTWLQKMADGFRAAIGRTPQDLGRPARDDGLRQRHVRVLRKYRPEHRAGHFLGIENWAANSLWKPWIAGMEKLNATLEKPVPLGYLTYHNSEEEHHSQATLDELLENFREPWFDAEKFLSGAERILTEGVQAYYESQLAALPDKRRHLAERRRCATQLRSRRPAETGDESDACVTQTALVAFCARERRLACGRDTIAAAKWAVALRYYCRQLQLAVESHFPLTFGQRWAAAKKLNSFLLD